MITKKESCTNLHTEMKSSIKIPIQTKFVLNKDQTCFSMAIEFTTGICIHICIKMVNV